MLGLGSQKTANKPKFSSSKPTIITVLDVGTTKVCCVIARLHPKRDAVELKGRTHLIEVIGFGHQRSRGVKAGMVVDLDEAEQAIRLAVDAAERKARMTVESLIVNISGGRIRSNAFSASVMLAGGEVEDVDLQRVLNAGRNHSAQAEAAVVHSLPIGYSLDGNMGIEDPRGLVGERLAVNMHVVTSHEASVRNLELAINRCHLAVEGFVVSPYAAGLAALAGDEGELGVTCIDMGGGTTTASIFAEGRFVHCDAIAMGGQHLTMALARGLSTSLQNAERIKVKHGRVLPNKMDDSLPIAVETFGDDLGFEHEVPASALSTVLRPRLEEIFETLRDRMNASGFGALAGRRIVLTGGAAQLTGVPELAREILGKNVRLGRPLGVTGLPMEARSSAFSTVMGLLIYPQTQDAADDMGWSTRPMARDSLPVASGGNYFSRVGRWFAENF